jgi:hypothetical protein
MTQADVPAQNVNIAERFNKLVAICAKHNPVGIASRDANGVTHRYQKGWDKRMDSGVHLSATIDEVVKDAVLLRHAVYTRKDDVLAVVKELKEANLGISVVISGVFDEVFDVCKKAETGPHTANLSAETLGKTELMPEHEVLELVTMCGHAFISRYLARYLIDRVKQGNLNPEDAAVELGKQCTCNIFNVVRGADLVRKAAAI